MNTKNLPVKRKNSIAVARLLDHFSSLFTVITGFQGIGRGVYISDVNRPGLALSGYLDYFASDRVQILGNTEIHYMERLSASELEYRLENMFSFEIPAFLLSRNLRPEPPLLGEWIQFDLPVRRDFETLWGVVPSDYDFLRVFFEVRWDNKEEGAVLHADVYYDDLFFGFED